MRKRVLSGIQPSGSLHLGNYFGAIRQWVEMQEKFDCYYAVVDLHALTSLRNPDELRRLTHEVAVTLLACGLDAERCVLFKQSDVSYHTELTWILSTVTSMGLLERAHAFKDKTAKGLLPNAGLFIYPVLQASDILLYSPHLVPVGRDQQQHIEMTRDMAEKFNSTYGVVFDPLPEAFIPEEVAVVPGTDGQKMSKSYGNTIPLFAKGDELKKAVMGIVTDSVGVADKKKAEGNTVFELYRLVATDLEISDMKSRFEGGGYGYGEAKKELLKKLEDFLVPIQERRSEIEKKKGFVEEVLTEGARKARLVAGKKMEEVRKAVGL